MNWPDNNLQSVERYLYQGDSVRIGKFDCRSDDACFPVSTPIADNMFVLATRPVWIRRRTRSYHYIGPGSILFHPAGCTLERQRGRTEGDTAYWFAVAPQLFEEALSTYGYEDHPPTHALAADPEIQLKLASILQQLRVDRVSAFDIESSVISLLDDICRSLRNSRDMNSQLVVRPSARARARRLVDRAKAHIDDNLADDIDLDNVARQVGLSAYYLCRLFKSACGITIHEYKTRQRLVHVLGELTGGHCTDLARLAMDTGFSSHSHLTRTFTRRYGRPPSFVRRLARDWAIASRV